MKQNIGIDIQPKITNFFNNKIESMDLNDSNLFLK